MVLRQSKWKILTCGSIRDIALLLDFIDKTIGKENSLVVLTSTCSSVYPVDYLKEEFNMPVGNFSPESAIALLKSFLNITYGQGDWIEVVSDQQLYFNHDLLEKKNISLEDIQTKTANFINQFEGVKIALPSASFAQGDYTKGQLAVIANSYNFKRSGDVLYQLEDGWQPIYNFSEPFTTIIRTFRSSFTGIQSNTDKSGVKLMAKIWCPPSWRFCTCPFPITAPELFLKKF